MFADCAPAFHRAGINVVPVNGEKVPLAPWKQWQARLQTHDELDALTARHGGMDIAVILRGMVDIETDSEAAERTLRDLRLPLAPTACWQSPRGTHRLYRTEKPLPSRLGLRPGLDVLSHGHYAIAPTSTGREWLLGLDALAPLPAAWHDALLQPVHRAALRVAEHHGADEGTRNNTLARLVGCWLTQGVSGDDLTRCVLAWARRCRPPLAVDEALSVMRKIMQARSNMRSPERAALIRARERDLDPAARFVLIALEAHRQELGAPATFAAPLRKVAGLTGYDPASVARAYSRLRDAGLIELFAGRDPTSGRRISTVRFLP